MENGHFQLYITDSVVRHSRTTFDVVTKKRVWALECKSEDMCTEWVDCICSVIGTAPIIKYKDYSLEPGMNGYDYDLGDEKEDYLDHGDDGKGGNGPGWNDQIAAAAYTDGGDPAPAGPPAADVYTDGGDTAPAAPSAMMAMDVAPSAPDLESMSEGIVTGDPSAQ